MVLIQNTDDFHSKQYLIGAYIKKFSIPDCCFSLLLIQSFWAEEQLECLEGRLPVQLLLHSTACSILHHFGLQVVSVEEWFWFSCYLLLRYRLTQELQLLSIPSQRKDKLELQLRHVQHSFLFGEDDGSDQLEIVAQHEMIVTWPWSKRWRIISTKLSIWRVYLLLYQYHKS